MILVTGATGFLGRHVVDHLVARGRTVRCLVRPTSLPAFEALRAARWAGADVCAVPGDVEAEGCGLSAAERASLTPARDVLHVAALYRLDAGADALRRANVDGTRNVLLLARTLGARLHHVSSIAVAGDAPGRFAESALDVGQRHPHPYARTKFEAEVLVRAEAAAARVYRPGMIVGHSVTGQADRADGLYLAFPLIRALRGALPAWFPLVGLQGGPVPLAPVDFVAAAIDALVHADALDGGTFHLLDPAPPPLGVALNTLAAAAHAPRFAVRLGTPLLRAIPTFALDAARASGPARRLRERHFGGHDLAGMAGLVLGGTTFDTAAADAALASAGVVCPRFPDYAAALWDHWDRRLRPAAARTLADAVSGKVVLVTGASSGIGEAVARSVAAAGATTLLVARSADALAALAASIEADGGRAEAHPCDLADEAATSALVARVLAAHARVDVLINNAGRSIRRSFARSVERPHDFARTMELNYFGALRLILAFVPGMRARGDGHVVNVLTVGLQARVPRYAAYVASKAALDAASASIAAEVWGDGVRFTAVYMPLVRTPMIEPSKHYEAFPALSPEEAARLVAGALIDRPPRVSTPLGSFARVVDLLAPALGLRVLSAGARSIPEDDPPPPDPSAPDSPPRRPGVAARILANLHW